MLNIYNISDEKNYKDIFEKFYKPLVLFASSKINDPEASEDLVQDVFIYIWKKNIIFENELSIKSYLYRSVLNKCINFIRDNKSKREDIHNIENDAEYSENSLMNDIIREEVYRKLISAINSLPPRCKQIFEMAQDGMTSSEIAEQLGLATETVKKQRKIARKILHENLNQSILLLILLKKINSL